MCVYFISNFLLPLRALPDYTKGFGGKFGVETDKVDKSAVGFEYQGKTEKHESQKGGYLRTESIFVVYFCGRIFMSVRTEPMNSPSIGV